MLREVEKRLPPFHFLFFLPVVECIPIIPHHHRRRRRRRHRIFDVSREKRGERGGGVDLLWVAIRSLSSSWEGGRRSGKTKQRKKKQKKGRERGFFFQSSSALGFPFSSLSVFFSLLRGLF